MGGVRGCHPDRLWHLVLQPAGWTTRTLQPSICLLPCCGVLCCTIFLVHWSCGLWRNLHCGGKRGKRLTHLAVMPPWFGCVASIVMVVSAANTGTTVRPMPVPVQERGRLCVSIFGGNGRLPQPLKNKDQRTTASSGLDYYCVLVHGVQRAAAHAHAHTRSE